MVILNIATILLVLNLGNVCSRSLSQKQQSSQDHLRKPEIELICNLPQDLVDEISGYSWLYQNLSDLILDGAFKGRAYQDTATFVDTFGPRKFGTESLENSIDYLADYLESNGIENVHTENVSGVPGWTRGNESLYMVQPRFQQLALLGSGSSIGTPPEGVTAEIIVVKSFDELDERAAEIPGKIVVYNEPFESYHFTVAYRSHGPARAAQYGAVASLTRSITPKSIYSPHTGWQDYEDGIPKIPAASITIEDAEMLQRMVDRGTSVTLTLKMGAESSPDTTSRNIIGEWIGSESPDEIVIVSGHIDSWDVGQGASDDAAGLFISALVPIIFKDLGLRAKRTIRAIGWTAEEPGEIGAYAYRDAHLDEMDNFDLVMESDQGTFNPNSLDFMGTIEAACIVQEILKLAEPLNLNGILLGEFGSDTDGFSGLGVPTASLEVKVLDPKDEYFAYHHSPGDMMTVEDPDQLDKCLLLWAVTSYVVADLSIMLPRGNSTTSMD